MRRLSGSPGVAPLRPPRPLPGGRRNSTASAPRLRGASRLSGARPGTARVVMLRPTPPSRRRLAAMALGLILIGAGVAVVGVAATSSSHLDQVLGAYGGSWMTLAGALKLTRPLASGPLED